MKSAVLYFNNCSLTGNCNATSSYTRLEQSTQIIMTAICVHKNGAADKVWLCREEVKRSRRKQPRAGEQHINILSWSWVSDWGTTKAATRGNTELTFERQRSEEFQIQSWSHISLNVLDVGRIQVSTSKAASFQSLIKEGFWCFTAEACVQQQRQQGCAENWRYVYYIFITHLYFKWCHYHQLVTRDCI